MRKNLLGIAVFILLFIAMAVPMYVSAKDAVNLDVFQSTINGKPIFQLTLEQLISIIGKPTKTEPEKSMESSGIYFGEKAYFHNFGLSFQFMHSAIDKKKRCALVKVYLIEKTDESMEFNRFSGTLSNGISSEWTNKRLLKDLAGYGPTDRMAKAKFSAGASDAVKRSYAGIDIKRSGFNIAILYDPSSGSLESLSLISHNWKFNK